MPAGFLKKLPLSANLSRASSADLAPNECQSRLTGSGKDEENTEPWVVSDKEVIPEELLPHLTQVRHGYGIQIYANKTGRYAGDWVFNKRTGEGAMVFQDGSEYKGQVLDGQMHGIGHFKWPTQAADQEDEDCVMKVGHNYIGMWKCGIMHGAGKF